MCDTDDGNIGDIGAYIMILVIGGAYQGKYEFVRNELNIPDDRIWNRLHEYIREHEDEKRCVDKIDAWIADNPDGVLICDEVGCGVVPIDDTDREYRDRVGHIQIRLAREALAVYRVTCGIGIKIK